MTEQAERVDEDMIGAPIGTGMPHTRNPTEEFPQELWELHTLESWARAFLASLLDSASRPPVPAPGQTPVPPHFSGTTLEDDVNFHVVVLEDSRLGVAATVRHKEPGGEWAHVHHLLKLDLVATGLTVPPLPPTDSAPETPSP
jgi:hypothetical protein